MNTKIEAIFKNDQNEKNEEPSSLLHNKQAEIEIKDLFTFQRQDEESLMKNLLMNY